uniref:PARP-type domain-containing protein n=1 Tax=Panagrolaimus sp. ES5 TaxID=591445 RepID=A0AC34FRD4_9BILA
MSNEKASSSSGPQFNTDYAKSDTSYCRGCHELISMGVLRMSVRYCPDMRDRIQDNWFHVECFDDFAGDEEIDENIGGIELLQWEDQEMIRQKIADSK